MVCSWKWKFRRSRPPSSWPGKRIFNALDKRPLSSVSPCCHHRKKMEKTSVLLIFDLFCIEIWCLRSPRLCRCSTCSTLPPSWQPPTSPGSVEVALPPGVARHDFEDFEDFEDFHSIPLPGLKMSQDVSRVWRFDSKWDQQIWQSPARHSLRCFLETKSSKSSTQQFQPGCDHLHSQGCTTPQAPPQLLSKLQTTPCRSQRDPTNNKSYNVSQYSQIKKSNTLK